MRKYFIHISYNADLTPDHFLVWCEIYNSDKEINKVATKTDLAEVWNWCGLSNLKSIAAPFLIPHVENIPIYPHYHYLHDQPLHNSKVELHKKFIDCALVEFADFDRFLNGVYGVNNELVFTTTSFGYHEMLFLSIKKVIFKGYLFWTMWYDEYDGCQNQLLPVFTDKITTLLDPFKEKVPPICRIREQGAISKELYIDELVKNVIGKIFAQTLNKSALGKGAKSRKLHPFLNPENKSELCDLYDYQLWQKWAANSFSEDKLLISFKQIASDEEEVEGEEKELLWQMDFALKTPDKIVHGHRLFTRYAKNNANYLTLQRVYAKELFKAAAYSKFIKDALLDYNTDGTILSIKELLHFLKEEAAGLIDKGILIRYPRFWQKIGKINTRVSFKRREGGSSSLSNGMLNSEAVLDFNWQIIAGSRSLTVDELQNLLLSKEKFIKIDQEYFELDVVWLNSLINKLQKDEKRFNVGVTLAEALNYEAPCMVDRSNIFEEVLYKAKKGLKFQNLAQPKELQGVLRHYQLSGFNFMSFMEKMGFGCVLADDMGLGKTIQTIALLLNNRNKKPDLIVAPTTLLYNWESEISRFAPNLKFYTHYGNTRNKDLIGENEIDIIICSYGVLKRDLLLFKSCPFNRVVLDEAQYIKNPFSEQAKAVKDLNASFRVALSGTPIENRLLELWSIMDYCNPGLLLTASKFREKYELPIMKNQDESKKSHLKDVVSPFLLRRMKTDADIAGELPEKQETKVWLSLTDEQIILYDREIKNIENKILNGGNDIKGLMLAALTKLKQICNHPELLEKQSEHYQLGNRSNKLDHLLQMVRTISAEQRKVLVFTQFVETAQLITKYLKQELLQDVLLFYGGITINQRKKIIEEFESSTNCPVLVLSLRAGGLGLNLTAANYVIHFDRWWNPAVENQAIDRVYRLGQTRHTFIYKYICKGTLEEKIDKLIESKMALSDGIIPKGDSILSGLDAKTFLNMIKRG